jgi:hypothetical protein
MLRHACTLLLCSLRDARKRVVATIVALVFVSTGTPLQAQSSVFMGGALLAGSVQTPYVHTCSGKPGRAFGATPYVGIEMKGVAITAGYVQVTKTGIGDCRVPPPPPDGPRKVREFRITHSGIYGWAFNLRYAPAWLPLMAHAGGGLRFGGNDLGDNHFVSYGIALRTRGRLSLFAGLEVTQLHTRYFLYDQIWQGGDLVVSNEVDRGFGWRKLKVLRFGVEYRILRLDS